jgi:hypothetical protein
MTHPALPEPPAEEPHTAHVLCPPQDPFAADEPYPSDGPFAFGLKNCGAGRFGTASCYSYGTGGRPCRSGISDFPLALCTTIAVPGEERASSTTGAHCPPGPP